MWKLPQKIERRKVTGPYRYFNYALLHSIGITGVFNFMRYNVAFLARRSDYEMLLEASQGESYADYMTRRFAILLCRYDWAGKTKPHWEHGMLFSSQELEEITDPSALYELGSDITELRTPTKPSLKWEHVLEIEGNLQYVLRVMYENRALPNEEVDANRIEQAFYPSSGKDLHVKLRNFLGVESDWKLPPISEKC